MKEMRDLVSKLEDKIEEFEDKLREYEYFAKVDPRSGEQYDVDEALIDRLKALQEQAFSILSTLIRKDAETKKVYNNHMVHCLDRIEALKSRYYDADDIVWAKLFAR